MSKITVLGFQTYLVGDPLLPQTYLVGDPRLPQTYLVGDPLLPQTYLVGDPLLPQTYLVGDPLLPQTYLVGDPAGGGPVHDLTDSGAEVLGRPEHGVDGVVHLVVDRRVPERQRHARLHLP